MAAAGWLLGWVVQSDGSFGNSQELNYLESCALFVLPLGKKKIKMLCNTDHHNNTNQVNE